MRSVHKAGRLCSPSYDDEADMDAGKGKRRKKPLSRPFVVTVAAVGAGIPAIMAVGAGCGESKPAYSSFTGGPSGQTELGSCGPEGATQPCRIDLGTSNGFRGCFSGTKTCTGGVWSKCGGEGVVTNSAPGALVPAGLAGGGDLSTLALSDASADASICAFDPCNPYCNGWDTDAAVSLDAAGTQIVGVSGFGQISNGHLKKALNDPCHNNAVPVCDLNAGGSLFACQIDTYCSLSALGGTGCCVQYKEDNAGSLPSFLGSLGGSLVNLTAGTPCGTTTYRNLPICNRGTVPLTAPNQLTVQISSPGSQLPTSSCPAPVASPTCSMPVPLAGINPGECVLMDLSTACAGGIPSGTRYLYVNADYSIPEGPVTPVVAQPLQPGCADNWSVHPGGGSANNPPACYTTGENSTTFQQTYQATCPQGTHAQWHELTWDTTCPRNASGSSEVIFEAATAPSSSGVPGTFSSFITVGEAQNQTPTYLSDPEKCGLSGPATDWACTNADTSGTQLTGPTPPCCPKSFLDQFSRGVTASPFAGVGASQGADLANQEFLQLQITLNSSPDGVVLPTLNSWQISYSCLPSE